MTYDKPLLIIYNPSSGRRVDQRDLITSKLMQNSIKYEYHDTFNKPGKDADDIIRDADFEKYSAIIIVGGDGTIHKAVNGMM